MSLSLNTQYLLWIIITAVAVSLFVFWVYRQVTAQLSSRTGWGLMFIRIAAVALLLFTICEPAASIMLNRTEKARLLLLIDTSDSMSITDRTGHRIQNAIRLLKDGWYNHLSDRYQVQTYQFAETVTPISDGDFDSLTVQKAGTDMGAALEFARTRAQLDDIAGVILMTDGNHTVGREPLRAVDGIGLPVYTIGVGDTVEPKDAAIIGHLTNDVAYVDSKVPVEITIRSRGYEGKRLPVTLTEEDRIVDTQYVTLAGDGREQSVLLHMVPMLDGIRQFTVSIPSMDDELVLQNNHRSFSIKILKTKLGILYIEGSPRTDQTFIKQTLKRDPNVRLTAVFLKPDGGFFPEPLPDSRSEWYQYDLIILGSIPESRLRPWEQHIVDLVEHKGGALVALGGSRSFELGGYAGTPLGNMMPVDIPVSNRGLLEGLFLPTLTADGRIHALMQLNDDAVISTRGWAELPPLPGINQVGPAKPGATVLATHPTWQVQGQPAPVIAVQRYGLGKVLAIATYDLWRWDLMMWGAGGANASYVRFWSNVVRWMTTREGSQRVRVATEKLEYRSGERIDLRGQAYDESYRPIDGAAISVDIVPKQGNEEPIRVELAPTGDKSGRYVGSLRRLPAGEYSFVARATYSGQSLGTDTGGFNIGESAIEYDRTRMNQGMLSDLAALTGGRFYRIDGAEQLFSDVDFPDKVVAGASDIHLWNHPAALILFILLLSIEWLLRRRHGLM